MMTYRALKKFINENTQPNNIEIFDLITFDIKSKIIFVIGEGASNTIAYLSSIMRECDISHLNYTSGRLLKNSEPLDTELLCEKAETLLKATKRLLSNEDLFFTLSLSFSDCDYLVIEMSEEYYNHIKDCVVPFAIILTIKDDLKAKTVIQNAPSGTKEIISLSQEDDFDYISSKINRYGARISLASPNKITVSSGDLLGIDFYHYDYLYHTSALDLNNVSLAHLSIEAASILFGVPRPYIYKGLEKAKISHDFVLYSLSPAILLRVGDENFKLHRKLKFKTVRGNDEFEYPKENTIFCGSGEYIEQIKEKLKKR